MKKLSITPERAQKILKELGTDVTLEEAKKIIEFLQPLAKTKVAQYLREEEPASESDIVDNKSDL